MYPEDDRTEETNIEKALTFLAIPICVAVVFIIIGTCVTERYFVWNIHVKWLPFLSEFLAGIATIIVTLVGLSLTAYLCFGTIKLINFVCQTLFKPTYNFFVRSGLRKLPTWD